MASAGRILIIPRGEWNPESTYEMLDLLSHGGKAWMAKKTSIGIEPTFDNDEYWHPILGTDGSFVTETELMKIVTNMTRVLEISLPASGWTTEYPFTQTVNNESIEGTSDPTMVRILVGTESEEEVKSYEKAYGLIFAGETADGSATFYAKKLPEIDLVIGLKGV